MNKQFYGIQRMSRSAEISALMVVVLLLGGCMFRQDPPERDFDQTEAYQILHDAFYENIEFLDDFPGFDLRQYSKSECEHSDGSSTGFVRMEITYVFSSEDSDTELVRDSYFETFKEAWNNEDYDVHREDVLGDNEVKDLEARRPDGVNYWFRVWDRVALTIQSGCIRATDIDEPYIPPIGDVSPKNDQMHKFKNSDNTPSDDESEEAINPFAN